MGGKKRIGLKQMERQQAKEDKQKAAKEKKDKKSTPPKERKTTINVIPPDEKNEKIIAEVKKMSVLTPYAVATRYNVRMSAAKEFLQQLQHNGNIELVSGNHTIKVYKPCT
jgi:small subunit ribosomal protein S25e